MEIILYGMQWQDKDDKGKGKVKGKDDQSGTKRKRDKNKDTDMDDDSSEEDAVNKQVHWVLALQQKYLCGQHAGEYCKVGVNGIHLKLKSSDLSLWGLLLVCILSTVYCMLIGL